MSSDQLPVTSEGDLQEEVPQEESQASSPVFAEDVPKLKASATLTHPSSLCSDATRGVRPPRGTQAQVLQGAASRAAKSGRRNDVHEYMRLRRSYI